MELTVTTPVPDTAPADAYVVEIEVMYGDADGYKTFTMGSFKRGEHEENLQSLLETLTRMKAWFPHGRSSRDDSYAPVSGYMHWFEDYLYDPEGFQQDAPEAWASATPEEHEKFAELSEEFYKDWPMDLAYDNEYPAKLESYKVFYYDQNHVKHNVEVKL